ncbi:MULTISPECIES: hypothetical protein [unclassified Barnesiella]|jgi:hypothetical protein|uniref:hypothetical protein n=1 Tax=unclassified Barnesiella TaxID=2645177 RepID=UPI000B39D054|nr:MULTISPECIES: hypothetical protein [unclassified Barnesiella]MCR8912341.1 hypothetical protein [Barnesiella sp. ET7]OUN74322.1 hypothetical protein B5G10_01820 [Barnesiella sp. An55]OUO94162.1 hypothetical protein B5F38_14125 [Barnesiella sp. An22]HJB73136.1 hypothetical protein [Candidatus Barnesiella merdigallinarum]
MKTGNLFKILLLIIFATTFVACESEEKDGDWEAMKWETNVSNINKNKIEVPNEGGVYVIKCTNYKSFWINALSENGESLPIDNEDEKIEREWYSIKINDGNTMTVSILSNSSDDNRTLKIGIQAENAFDSFLFEQNKN